MVWNTIFHLRQYSFQNISIQHDTITFNLSTAVSVRFLQKSFCRRRIKK